MQPEFFTLFDYLFAIIAAFVEMKRKEDIKNWKFSTVTKKEKEFFPFLSLKIRMIISNPKLKWF